MSVRSEGRCGASLPPINESTSAGDGAPESRSKTWSCPFWVPRARETRDLILADRVAGISTWRRRKRREYRVRWICALVGSGPASRGCVNVRRAGLRKKSRQASERFVELDSVPCHAVAREHEQRTWEAALGLQLPTHFGAPVERLELDRAQQVPRALAESHRVVVERVPVENLLNHL